MNYGQMRDYILQLYQQIQYSWCKYALSYSNPAGLCQQNSSLINDGLIYIASSIQKLPTQKVYLPEDGRIFMATIFAILIGGFA